MFETPSSSCVDRRRLALHMLQRSFQLDHGLLANLRYARKSNADDFRDLLHRQLLLVVKRKNQLFSLAEFGDGFGQMRPHLTFETKVEWIRIVEVRRRLNH